VQLKNFEFN